MVAVDIYYLLCFPVKFQKQISHILEQTEAEAGAGQTGAQFQGVCWLLAGDGAARYRGDPISILTAVRAVGPD